jgi:hypothetical protein
MALTQEQLGCTDFDWYHHASERTDHYTLTGDTALADAWHNVCAMTWTRLTPRERRLITKHT